MKSVFQAANATLWNRIEHFGYEKVSALAEEIKQKSNEIAEACVTLASESKNKINGCM